MAKVIASFLSIFFLIINIQNINLLEPETLCSYYTDSGCQSWDLIAIAIHSGYFLIIGWLIGYAIAKMVIIAISSVIKKLKSL
ncbi:hypothetical protein [Photobacterium damselae]|uniref:hypothetical protein n=1 Tax=Photobacterium damselae TaxID=38293 RepID=UPI0040682D5F